MQRSNEPPVSDTLMKIKVQKYTSLLWKLASIRHNKRLGETLSTVQDY